MRRNAKVDSNQKEIVQQMRDYGCVVLHTHQLKNAFDLLVGFKRKLYIVEVKNGSKKLTEGELRCKKMFNYVGIDYHVITSFNEFKNILENECTHNT